MRCSHPPNQLARFLRRQFFGIPLFEWNGRRAPGYDAFDLQFSYSNGQRVLPKTCFPSCLLCVRYLNW